MNTIAPRILASICAGAAFAFSGCSKKESSLASDVPTAATRRPVVYVVNYPLYYFADRIGGSSISVVFPMKEPGDPAFWQPDAATITAYQRADLILLNGAGYSAWTEKAALPLTKTIDTAARFRSDFITSGETIVHSHGPGGEHSHPALAFTTWLDPRLAMLHADAIAEQVTRLLPQEKDAIAQRLAALKTDWNGWKTEFEAIVAPQRAMPVLASHPVYQYLEKAGGLNWRGVHWEPGEQPTAEQWKEFAALHHQHPAQWMVWEDEPAPSVRERLAKEFSVTCVIFNPCGDRPGSGNLLDVMRANLAQLRNVYAPARQSAGR